MARKEMHWLAFKQKDTYGVNSNTIITVTTIVLSLFLIKKILLPLVLLVLIPDGDREKGLALHDFTSPPRAENQMDTKMENEMESRSM